MRFTIREIIEKGIPFLESLKEENFIKREATKDSDPANIGKKHCAVGHLFLNPNSPLYDEKDIVEDGVNLILCSVLYNEVTQFNNLINRIIVINNKAKPGFIKSDVIASLKNYNLSSQCR